MIKIVKKKLQILFAILLLLVIPVSFSKVYYKFPTEMYFKRIIVEQTHVLFNTTNFTVAPYSGTVNVTMINVTEANSYFNITGEDQNVNMTFGNSSAWLYDIDNDLMLSAIADVGNVTINATTTPRQFALLTDLVMYLNGTESDSNYELGSVANITCVGPHPYISINSTGFDNVSADNGKVEYLFTTVSQTNTTKGSCDGNAVCSKTIALNNNVILLEGTLNISGADYGGGLPHNVTIKINNTIDRIFRGELDGETVTLDFFNDSTTTKGLSFDDEEGDTFYVELPRGVNLDVANITITGFRNYSSKYNQSISIVANHSTYSTDPLISYTCSNTDVSLFRYGSGTASCYLIADFSAYNIPHYNISRIIWGTYGYAFARTAEYGIGMFTANCTTNTFECPSLSTPTCSGASYVVSSEELTPSQNSTTISYHEKGLEYQTWLADYGISTNHTFAYFDALNSIGNNVSCRHIFNSSSFIRLEQQNVSFPENMFITVADGEKTWNRTAELNQTMRIDLNTTKINNWLEDCDATNGLCTMPITIYTDTTSNITINNITFQYNPNPVDLNETLIRQDISEDNALTIGYYNDVTPDEGLLQLNETKLSYRGKSTYSVTCYNSTDSVNLGMKVYFSNYTIQYPYTFYNGIFFSPLKNDTKNLNPYGQDSDTPIYNITWNNYDINANLGMRYWLGSLVYRYDFNENSSSSINDKSGNGHTGTLYNFANNTLNWTDGKYNSGLNFEGDGDYIEISSLENLPVNGTDHTITAWVKVDSYNNSGLGNYLTIAGWGNGSTRNARFLELRTNLWVYGGFYGQDFTLDMNLTYGEWYHIAWVYNGTHNIGYKDGIQYGVEANDTEVNTLTNSNNLRIGRGTHGYDNYFNGTIDEVRIYNRSLSDIEIKSIYEERRENNTCMDFYISSNSNYMDGMVGYWNFDQNSTIAYDFTENENDGNVSNALWNETGKYGGSFEFDGNGDIITISDNSVLNMTNENTMSVWAKKNKNGVWLGIIDKALSTSPYQGYELYYWTDDKIYCRYGNSTVSTALTSSAITDSNWHHIACILNTTGGYLYLDNNLNDSDISAKVVSSSVGLLIGEVSDTYGHHYFNGTIDEVYIFNRALNETEIANMYDRRYSPKITIDTNYNRIYPNRLMNSTNQTNIWVWTDLNNCPSRVWTDIYFDLKSCCIDCESCW